MTEIKKAEIVEEKPKSNLVIFQPQLALAGQLDEIQLMELRKAANFEQVTKAEMPFVAYKCAKLGLDPLLGEIVAVRRGSKLSVEPTIHGFRKIAIATGELAGSQVEFSIDESIEKALLRQGAKLNPALKKFVEICEGAGESPGIYAKATVVRRKADGEEQVYTYLAYAKEYFQPQGKWALGHIRTMLSVRAESQALRKAFSDSLSGVYTNEEMS